MKIGIVLNTSWNIYNFRRQLIKLLQGNSFEVIAIAPEDSYSKRLGCKFVPINNLYRKGTNPIKDLRLYYELKKIYKNENLKLILHYTIKPNIYGSLAAQSLGIPVINTVTGLGYTFMNESIINKIVKYLYRVSFQLSDLVLFQNIDDLNLFKGLDLLGEENSGLINGSGIDTSYFCQDKIRNGDIVKFLFVGRLLYDKGIRELMEAIKKLYKKAIQFEMTIVGIIDKGNPSAISEKDFTQFLESYPSVNYIRQSDNIKSILEEHDVFVLPSYREGMPKVILEAMAMSKPIITTNVPGCRETVVGNTNGFIIEGKTAAKLYDAMLNMAKLSFDEREQMGKVGRKIVEEKYDINIICKKYLYYVDLILNKNQ